MDPSHQMSGWYYTIRTREQMKREHKPEANKPPRPSRIWPLVGKVGQLLVRIGSWLQKQACTKEAYVCYHQPVPGIES
ncbi:hypothetical protein EPA93_09575 [Ktedonosporobacter rubrisoli]|uniref:Uncharacterized protein n=1 Tax=Ktedonosporobacter rubrisoli TaxID=2509675 RepID=A0A4P6JLZ3_KTERU|nr:hypothetical protein [Ktedonosporobacter rubrisoli]QBD76245.1 hypothetical protein EPA93_09575 [Ktedonosporobacter rubrisoli]